MYINVYKCDISYAKSCYRIYIYIAPGCWDESGLLNTGCCGVYKHCLCGLS